MPNRLQYVGQFAHGSSDLHCVKQNPIFLLHLEIVQSVFSTRLVPNYRTAKYEYLPTGILAIWLLALQKCRVSAFALFT